VLSLNPEFATIEASATRSLLERAQAGEAEAFCELCRLHETRLLRQALAVCGNPSLAEELAQDTLVEAWRSVHRYNGRCRFFTWLCAILLHRHRNVLRAKRPLPVAALAGREAEDFQASLAGLPDHDAPPDQAAQLREQAAVVRACIQALSPKHRQVIHLRFYVDDSLEGIAAALGCSVGTVKSRLFHALERLRAMNALSSPLAEP
jgi:RNA polymerase sigma-70 factor, ECF subfamily